MQRLLILYPAFEQPSRCVQEVHGFGGHSLCPLMLSRYDSVPKVEMTSVERQSKDISVNEEAQDDVMHLRRCGEADRRANQPFEARLYRQMRVRDLLGVPFARAVHLRGQML